MDHLPSEMSHRSPVSAPPSTAQTHRSAFGDGTSPPGRDDDGGRNRCADRLAALTVGNVGAQLEPEDVLRGAIDVCPFAVVMVEPFGRIVLANDPFRASSATGV